MTKTIKSEIGQMNKKIIKPTPFGSVCVIWHISNNNPLIVSVLLSKPGLSAEERASAFFHDARNSSCAEIDKIATSIKAYLEGDNIKFSLNSVDLSECTKFQRLVLLAQHAIPRGIVSSYGLVASRAGAPGGARAVGNVMASNPFPLIIPCHRTILSNFHLGGFGSGSEMKRALLIKEGIIFDDAGKVICTQFHYGQTKGI
jgi:methylated-DNA-[protein]-cysteine S-methyltransferase